MDASPHFRRTVSSLSDGSLTFRFPFRYLRVLFSIKEYREQNDGSFDDKLEER